ncbi:hypothetical protein B0J11DRAFT_514858 [Dendryphion nanum]|uniref:Uncharacterized protein n=1 Tax=Dendryphion nanum TaxID=256645 RepID=A0A9P9EJG9_9PLEO|nr:hypothetical protein B0J11DRAFT_514858 [Dendryphion nanum]
MKVPPTILARPSLSVTVVPLILIIPPGISVWPLIWNCPPESAVYVLPSSFMVSGALVMGRFDLIGNVEVPSALMVRPL